MFATDDGGRVPAVTGAVMRDIDDLAIQAETPNLYQMMENAGRNLAGAAIRHLGRDWRRIPITVYAGGGGNGGGGVAAARHLANRGGDVTVVVATDATNGGIVDQQRAVFRQTPGRVATDAPADIGLLLDALIGYGLTDAPRGPIAEAIAAIDSRDVPIISLDLPSGLDADSGDTVGAAVHATETLTLALPKPGLVAAAAGDLWLGDLGIPIGVYRRVGVDPPVGLFADAHRVHLNREPA